MAIAASSIVATASRLLQDSGNVRWTLAAMVEDFNSGQRAIVSAVPGAKTSNTNLTLTEGLTKQSIPATAVRLMDLVRNMGTDETPGAPIKVTTRELLDSFKPGWHSVAGPVIKNFILDERDPRTFYVYPAPNAPSILVEAILSTLPTDVTLVGSTVTGNMDLPDIYESAMVDWLMYRAFVLDSEHASNAARAAAHQAMFAAAVGLKKQADISGNPLSNSYYNVKNPAYGKATQL